jgi:uncharacterized protein (DUF305 family)
LNLTSGENSSQLGEILFRGEAEENMNRKVGLLVLAGFVIAAITFSWVSLSTNNDFNNMNGMDHSSMGHGSVDGKLSGQDVMFLQMMIPHHQQGVVISDYALTNSTNVEVLKLANQIKAAQQPEITQMGKWLNDAGLKTDPGHSMDGMGGMLTQDQLSVMAKSKGAAFDKLFLSGMIDHHKGAVAMVSMIFNSKNSQIKEFGNQIRISQSVEIELMESMLANIK